MSGSLLPSLKQICRLEVSTTFAYFKEYNENIAIQHNIVQHYQLSVIQEKLNLRAPTVLLTT